MQIPLGKFHRYFAGFIKYSYLCIIKQYEFISRLLEEKRLTALFIHNCKNPVHL